MSDIDTPIKPKVLHQPDIIMVKNWPRSWAFTCGECDRDIIAFGWFGYARCPFCRQQHGMKWLFPGSGY